MTNDTADQTIEEADRRVEGAKASLVSRVELLKHKVSDARHRFDVPAQITRNPLPAVGIAFALGAVVGFRRTAKLLPAPGGDRSLGSAAFAAFAAVALHVVREVAITQLGAVARQWWTEVAGGSQAPNGLNDDASDDASDDATDDLNDDLRAAERPPFL